MTALGLATIIWMACALLVLIVNLPPGIRQLREQIADLPSEEKRSAWFWFVFWATVTTLAFAPLTAAVVLARGGKSNFEDEDEE
jgi:hypothetical protein